jgi:hypothetical protein
MIVMDVLFVIVNYILYMLQLRWTCCDFDGHAGIVYGPFWRLPSRGGSQNKHIIKKTKLSLLVNR